MTTKFDCALGGVSLSSVHDGICILDIREDSPRMQMHLAPLPGDGQQLLSRRRESLTVHISFALHVEDAALRSQLLSTVNHWAEKGGVFTASHRPGKRLHVIASSFPHYAAGDWTQTLTLSLTTTFCPYWEDEAAVQGSGSSPFTLLVPGTAAAAPVNAVIINTGTEALTRLTLRCGDTQLFFEGLSLAPNGIFTFMYTEGVPTAWVSSVNALTYRTAQSSDDLLAPCGKSCTAYASGDQPVQATFSARGRYL